MARFIEIHPENPQPRAIDQTIAILNDDGLIAYPTDSGYALGCRIGNTKGLERIRRIRQLDDKHHFTLVCSSFSQLGQFVQLDNAEFRAVKAATPGPYTFILPATIEVPKRLQHPKKRTVGVRIPDHRIVSALLSELGEPILSSTLIMPGHDEAMTDSWAIKEELDHQLDAVIDGGADVSSDPTTVVQLTDGVADVVRVGAGDPAAFQV